jgi:AsnC family.
VGGLAGRSVVAYILVNVEVGVENEVRDEIIRRFDKAVTEARVTYGEYDIVVRVEVDSMKALETIISSIRSIGGVRRTVTLIAV